MDAKKNRMEIAQIMNEQGEKDRTSDEKTERLFTSDSPERLLDYPDF